MQWVWALLLIGNVRPKEYVTFCISLTISFATNFTQLSCPSKCKGIFKEKLPVSNIYSKILVEEPLKLIWYSPMVPNLASPPPCHPCPGKSLYWLPINLKERTNSGETQIQASSGLRTTWEAVCPVQSSTLSGVTRGRLEAESSAMKELTGPGAPETDRTCWLHIVGGFSSKTEG